MADKPRILVTGGAGYIGSHTCKVLAAAGYVPVTYDSLALGHQWAVGFGPLVEGDLADGDRIRDAITEYSIEAVVHFAANAYVGESVEDPRKYFRNNVVNSLNLLEAVVDMNVKHLVYSSTCSIYGIPKEVPIPEDHPQHPLNPYGESKRFVETATEWFGEAYGLQWAALRYFNAAGADSEGEIGEDHDPETHLIPVVIEAALGRRPHVEIFGTDYPTEDGTAVRDYVHVTDLGAAHLSALGVSLSRRGAGRLQSGNRHRAQRPAGYPVGARGERAGSAIQGNGPPSGRSSRAGCRRESGRRYSWVAASIPGAGSDRGYCLEMALEKGGGLAAADYLRRSRHAFTTSPASISREFPFLWSPSFRTVVRWPILRYRAPGPMRFQKDESSFISFHQGVPDVTCRRHRVADLPGIAQLDEQRLHTQVGEPAPDTFCRCHGTESNRRHEDFQSSALPTELPWHDGKVD